MAFKCLVNIDAGHGSNTAGKRTPPMPINIDFDGDGKIDVKKGQCIHEHTANVGIAILLEKELKYNGFQVMKTGWDDENAYDDEDTALSARQKQIKAKKADISISIHHNAFGDAKSFNNAEGIETFYHSTSSKAKNSAKLAKLVQAELIKNTVQKNRGVKSAEFAMCNATAMGVDAAILIECGFMTNLREAKLMGTTDFWLECAQEMARGICAYKGVTYKKRRMDVISVKDPVSGSTGSTAIAYVVRKTFATTASQAGAYSNLDYAKKCAENKKAEGYKVFSKDGKLVYDPNSKKEIGYVVRTSFVNKSSQAGYYNVLENAKKCATDISKQKGVDYTVFESESGKAVYTATAPKAAKESEKVYKTVKSSNGVNVRKTPNSIIGKKLGAIACGKKVEILGTSGNWYKVKATVTTGKVVEGYCVKSAF